MTLGNRIKFLRKRANITQSELAEKLNLSFGTISKYEKDEISIPSETLLKIANIFNVSTDFLLGRVDIKNESIAIAASIKDNVDLSDVSNEDKEAIMRFVEMAKNKNKNKNKKIELIFFMNYLLKLNQIKSLSNYNIVYT